MFNPTRTTVNENRYPEYVSFSGTIANGTPEELVASDADNDIHILGFYYYVTTGVASQLLQLQRGVTEILRVLSNANGLSDWINFGDAYINIPAGNAINAEPTTGTFTGQILLVYEKVPA